MDKFEFLKIIYNQCMKDWDVVQQEKEAMSDCEAAGLVYNINLSAQQYTVILNKIFLNISSQVYRFGSYLNISLYEKL